MTSPLSPDRLAILRTADILEKVGWRQGTRTSWSDNDPLCILEALARSTKEDIEIYCDARKKLTAHFGVDPIYWNDTRGRTQEEVLAGVRACAVKGL